MANAPLNAPYRRRAATLEMVAPAPLAFEGPIVLGLGSNLGDRRGRLERACELLEQCGVTILGRSRIYHTRAWGVEDQPDFLNAALEIATVCDPFDLLALCLGIENEIGKRKRRHWGEREIDIDLILYGRREQASPELILPHPYLARRDFVLAPLRDLDLPVPEPLAFENWQAPLESLPATERSIISVEEW